MKAKNEKQLEKIKKYQLEGRGDWWFYPLWKKILYVVLMPFIMVWVGICWLLMKFGRGIYMLGDFLTGNGWNGGNWTEDV